MSEGEREIENKTDREVYITTGTFKEWRSSDRTLERGRDGQTTKE